MPQDPLARMGLSRSPIAKLFKPTPEQMEEPQMTEDMRSFAIQQQAIDTQLKNLQKQNVEQQNALAAEQAAQQYYQQPASARERFLDENPQTWSSSAGPGIYREQMMQQRQPSLADRTLAPTIASKLPVTARGEFMSLIEAGVPVMDAKYRVELKDRNNSLRAKMAEVMTPEEIEQGYGGDDAPLDEVRVMSEIAQRKRAGKGETDLQREYLLDALSTYERGAADKLLLADDPEYQSLVGRLKELDKKRLEKFAPPPVKSAAPAQQTPTGKPAPTNVQAAPAISQVGQETEVDLDTQIANLPYARQQEFLDRREQAQKAKEEEQKVILPAWQKAKDDIAKKITSVVPDEKLKGTNVNRLESFARAVLNPNENIVQTKEYGTVPVGWLELSKAGVPMSDIMSNATVFREPGEKRRIAGFLGTQQVGYQELLKAWAEDFLNQRGKLLPTSESPTGSIPTPEQTQAFSKVMAKIQGTAP